MAFAKITEADIALPISSNAFRLLAWLRITCWSKPRELTYDVIRESVPLGKDALRTAIGELVKAEIVTATARPGNRWRYGLVKSDADDSSVDVERDGNLPSMGRASRKGLEFRARTPKHQSGDPTDTSRVSRPHQAGEPTDTKRVSRLHQSGHPTASVGSPDCISRVTRLLTGALDLVDHEDVLDAAAVDGSAAAAVIEIRPRLDPTRAAYVDAIESSAAARERAPGNGGETIKAKLDAIRESFAEGLEHTQRLRVISAEMSFGRREDKDENRQQLERLWTTESADVEAVWRWRLQQVAAGSLEPRLAAGTFNGSGAAAYRRAQTEMRGGGGPSPTKLQPPRDRVYSPYPEDDIF